MWVRDFLNELKVWREVRKVYRENTDDFLNSGLKMDWVGHIYKVINRDVKIPLGTPEDENLLRVELNEIQELLIRHNLIDILAYELKPLEEDDGKTYEHAYLITFTPAYSLEKQYVTMGSVTAVIFSITTLLAALVTSAIYLVR